MKQKLLKIKYLNMENNLINFTFDDTKNIVDNKIRETKCGLENSCGSISVFMILQYWNIKYDICEFIRILENEFSNANNQFLYIANDSFHEQIIKPTLQILDSESDSSELFARAIKLTGMFIPKVKMVPTQNIINTSNILVKKKDAIDCINTNLRTNANNNNVIFSNTNSMRDIWWFEPQNERFKSDMYLALYDNKHKLLNVFHIPANSISDVYSTFYQRPDKTDKSSLIVSIDDPDYIDVKRGFSFKKYLIGQFDL